MKRGRSWMSGAVGIALVAATTGLAEAQNGPYYAVPSWDQTLACSSTTNCPRFVVVMGGAAVLDRETGLVWEKSPSDSKSSWKDAQKDCNHKVVGDRKGWRLPTIPELASLIDPNVPAPGPMLPAGHPFVGVQSLASDYYWSSTPWSNGIAWVTGFEDGAVVFATKTELRFLWCVRGGHSTDAQ